MEAKLSDGVWGKCKKFVVWFEASDTGNERRNLQVDLKSFGEPESGTKNLKSSEPNSDDLANEMGIWLSLWQTLGYV